MKKLKKRRTGLFLALVCLMSLLVAVPVRAAVLSDEYKASLGQSAQEYLQSAMALDDSAYDELRDAGGFYEVFVDGWRNAREDTGELVGIGEVTVTQEDDTVECRMPAEFENYSGELVMTFELDSAGSANPRNFTVNVDYPLSKSLEEAGINTAIGLIIVFVILFFLSGVIYLIRYVNPDMRNKKAAQAAAPAEKKAAPAPAAVPAPAPAAAAAPEEDIELAIVLATAIAAAEAEQPSGDGYVVRSIRKIRNKNWKRV